MRVAGGAAYVGEWQETVGSRVVFGVDPPGGGGAGEEEGAEDDGAGGAYLCHTERVLRFRRVPEAAPPAAAAEGGEVPTP